MKFTDRYKLVIIIVSILNCSALFSQPVKIMPLGNSITYDDNTLDKTNPRPAGDRISYRYKLYQLLSAAGYDFDYVGSENSGNNYFQDNELDDNAGFPGIESGQLATLINTGYNPTTGLYESAGPYLNYYSADIILLHIGTNNLIESASDVEQLLDIIRSFDSDVIILVARIINRRTYDPSTTTFNNNVELMIADRNDDRIISVNMETGAGINYSTDMVDNLHPNQTGYDKMAEKWFQAIEMLNQPPVISDIPEQITPRGHTFDDINLDTIVADPEDEDFQLSWTYKKPTGSNLNVSIDANRVLHVNPLDNNWYGSETLKLIVEDSGNGAFKKKDSIDILFTVQKENEAPVFTSSPVTQVDQDALYSYRVKANDVDGDSIIYTCPQKPSWLTFNAVSHKLTGTPDNDQVGFHDVVLRVSDSQLSSDQSFQIEVVNVNDPPVILSTPVKETNQGESYTYTLEAEDPDLDDLTYSALQKPVWMSFNAQSHILSGVPGNDNIGVFDIILRVSDGDLYTDQEFNLTVNNVNDPPMITSEAITQVLQDQNYSYTIKAYDADGDLLSFSVPDKPAWLEFSKSTHTLSGRPLNKDVGVYPVVIEVSDGTATVEQSYDLTVVNVNDLPVFTSVPDTSIVVGESYVYNVTATDIDAGDVLTFTALSKPDWLNFSTGTQDAMLYGTPTVNDVESHAVILQVSDGTAEVLQGYTLRVTLTSSVPSKKNELVSKVYPNPAKNRVHFETAVRGRYQLFIYDVAGEIRLQETSENTGSFIVDISSLPEGVYIYHILINEKQSMGKIIKK